MIKTKDLSNNLDEAKHIIAIKHFMIGSHSGLSKDKENLWTNEICEQNSEGIL